MTSWRSRKNPASCNRQEPKETVLVQRTRRPPLQASLSFEGNYHINYYYPSLATARAEERLLREASGCDSNGVSGEPSDVSTGPYVSGEPEASGADEAGNPRAAEQTAACAAGTEICQDAKCVCVTSTPPIKLSDNSMESICPGREIPKKRENSFQSSTSDDTDITVFSEDYTEMAEPGDVTTPPDCVFGLDGPHLLGLEGDGSSRTKGKDDEDADSSFTDDCSVSTLDLGKEDVVDNDADLVNSGHGVVVGTPHPHHRPDVRLLLGHPVPVDDDDDDDDSDLLSSPDFLAPEVEVEDMNDIGIRDAAGARSGGSDQRGFYEDDEEFQFLGTEPVRRSTSLKTYKTPPGTPKKKAVRFADALGLDLESVRHVLNMEDPPLVPRSAMRDLNLDSDSLGDITGSRGGSSQRSEGVRYLSACFPQPVNDPNFLRRVRDCKAVLENCLVDDKAMTVSGTVRVANIAYHKQVKIRYTFNNWLTCDDILACYVQNSFDGSTDRFSFTLSVPPYFDVGSRLAFAVMYDAGGQTFWDNNHSRNYVVECYNKSCHAAHSDNSWMSFL